MSALLVRGARQLLTLRGPAGPRRGSQLSDLGLIPDGAILIVDGTIRESGPARRVENLAASRRAIELDVAGKVVLPSFVDPVTHVSGIPPRSADFADECAARPLRAEDERALETALTQQRRQSPAGKLAFHATRVLREMVHHGAGTVAVLAALGLEDSPGAKVLRATSKLDRAPLDVVQSLLIGHPGIPEFHGMEDDYVRWLADLLLPRLARRDPVQGACACIGYGVLDDFQASDCLAAAGRFGLRLSVLRGLRDEGGAVGAALAYRAAHMAGLSELPASEIVGLAASSTVAVLQPLASFHGWRAPEPARELVDAGAAIALSTGWHPVLSPAASVPAAMALACCHYGLAPAEAVSAATANGAAALGLLDRCGTLEPGKQGDFLVLAIPDFRELPYTLGVNPVETVVKRGEVVWQKSPVTWPDEYGNRA
jgi:imidazolonepropionase